MLAAASHPDAREALRGGIRGVAGMYAAHRDVLRALNSMAQLDADAVGGAVQKMDEGRAGGMAAQAQRLAEQGILRADVTVDAATDLLCLLTSFDSFDLLHTGRARRRRRGAADHCCRAQPVPAIPGRRLTNPPTARTYPATPAAADRAGSMSPCLSLTGW
jgi:hypothetical protein